MTLIKDLKTKFQTLRKGLEIKTKTLQKGLGNNNERQKMISTGIHCDKKLMKHEF